MEFLKPKGVGGAAKLKQQLLTVGDAAGNLHVYDVPQNLWRPLANERAIMSYFLEREIKVFMEDLSIVAPENDLFEDPNVIPQHFPVWVLLLIHWWLTGVTSEAVPGRPPIARRSTCE